jgi:hypothetical protein
VEGVVKEVKPKQEKKSTQQQKEQQTSFLAFPQQEHFYYEFALLAAIVLYFLNVLIGSASNRSIVTKFADEFDSLLEEQFSSVEREGVQFEK